MDNFQDFVPKKTMCKVGDLDLTVAELVAAQRDALVKMVGEKMQAVNVRAMLRQARTLVDQEVGDQKVEGQETEGPSVLDIVLEVFTGMLTDAECVVLDTPTNRTKVAEALGEDYTVPKIDELPVHDKHGVEHWAPLWAWVRTNITDKQGLELVRMVIQLNDFAGLVKNLTTLASDLFPGLGGGQETTQEQ